MSGSSACCVARCVAAAIDPMLLSCFSRSLSMASLSGLTMLRMLMRRGGLRRTIQIGSWKNRKGKCGRNRLRSINESAPDTFAFPDTLAFSGNPRTPGQSRTRLEVSYRCAPTAREQPGGSAIPLRTLFWTRALLRFIIRDGATPIREGYVRKDDHIGGHHNNGPPMYWPEFVKTA